MVEKTLLTRLKFLIGKVPSPARGGESEELRQAREELAERNRRIRKLRERLEERDRELEDLRVRVSGGVLSSGAVKADRIVWIFCTGRSGSTWLASMMGDLDSNEMWDEPLVGALFGEFYDQRVGHKRGAKFIMGPRHKGTWLGSIRSTVLEGAGARYPGLGEGGYLVVKEPHGSVGAPLLVEALPESRVVLLVRDPRDIMASALDGHKKDSWIARNRNRKPGKGGDPDTFVESESDPDAFVQRKAAKLLWQVDKAREAYEKHEGPKAKVTYEELRADALGTMKRLCSELGMGVSEEEIGRVVREHAFEGIPEDERGKGKFYRKATPGGWREDLTEGQARAVEEATGPLLDEFYPGWQRDRSGNG
jgi:sulfotransferase family protein